MGTDHHSTGIPTWVLRIGAVFAAAAVAFLCVLGYWVIDRSPPLVGVSGRFLGWDPNTPRRGHVVWGAIQVRPECEGTIFRFIVNGEIVRLEPRVWEYRGPIDSNGEIPTTWDADFDVPPHINHDAKYRNRFEFVCNPLHKFWPIPVSPPDVPFYLRPEDKVMPYVPGIPSPPPGTMMPKGSE